MTKRIGGASFKLIFGGFCSGGVVSHGGPANTLGLNFLADFCSSVSVVIDVDDSDSAVDAVKPTAVVSPTCLMRLDSDFVS